MDGQNPIIIEPRKPPQKYAAYDTEGCIIGFYASDVHSTIPEHTIEITNEEWRDCLTNQGKWMVDTVNGVLILAPEKVLTLDEKLVSIRNERNRLIAETDWIMLPDVPLTEENRQQWLNYRQALRDFTETCDPDNPTWPAKPEYINMANQ